MAKSMTGYGRADSNEGRYKFTVEINTVNNRFLEYQIRLPKSLVQLENDIKSLLNQFFQRGKIMVTVNLEQGSIDDAIALDETKAEVYFNIYEFLRKKFDLEGPLNLRDFVALPDLLKIQKADDDLKDIWAELESVSKRAGEAASAMRRIEGDNLAIDMRKRAADISVITAEIESLSAENVKIYQAKLKTRIQELMSDSPVDEQRIALEVAVMAEKSDVSEECIRLKSHLEQFISSLSESDAVGRKLNFILQELNREANTIGSKSSFYDISGRVIRIKEEIERLREQVQNIE
jgi:uncharacterized protein (TIGR00255 family)